MLESKLNGNLIKAVNTQAVSLFRYTAETIDWTKEEIRKFEQRKKKLLTVRESHHPKDNIQRLYRSWKEGGRGHMGMENCVEMVTIVLEM